jgi:4,5-dihydroxyphthalate decarboxylase
MAVSCSARKVQWRQRIDSFYLGLLMTEIQISIASGDYDRTRALKDGRVRVAGCAVTYSNVEPNQLFKRILRAPEFDVSEMSFSTYIVQREQGKGAYTAIPVFLSRAFRHSAIFVRTDRGIRTPQDLKGKRVGTPEYFTTMLVWLRGLLSDEYDVKPSDLFWHIGGQEQPASAASELSSIPGVSIESIPVGKTLSGMLADGDIDALFAARPPSCFQRARNVARLFPDYRSDEQAYYRKSGIYPLMHAVGIRNSLIEAQPDLPSAVYDGFLRAKELAISDLERLSAFAVTLPWVEAEYRATQAVLGKDIWPYGISENTRTIATLCRYLHEQGFTKRTMTANELFVPLSGSSAAVAAHSDDAVSQARSS